MNHRSEASLAEIESMIVDLGYGTVEYHEALAMYGLMIARSQWRLAELARRRQEKTQRNKERRA